jgi:hypothetical protein
MEQQQYRYFLNQTMSHTQGEAVHITRLFEPFIEAGAEDMRQNVVRRARWQRRTTRRLHG